MQTTSSPAGARTTGPRISAFRACMALGILSAAAAPQNALASSDTQRLQNIQNFLARPFGLSASDQATLQKSHAGANRYAAGQILVSMLHTMKAAEAKAPARPITSCRVNGHTVTFTLSPAQASDHFTLNVPPLVTAATCTASPTQNTARITYDGMLSQLGTDNR